MSLLSVGTAAAQEGALLFSETFDGEELTLAYYDDQDYFEPEILTEDGDSFGRLSVTNYAWIEPWELDIWQDYRLDVVVRIRNGTFYMSGRSGDTCQGYDLIYTADGALSFNRMNDDCDYDVELGSYADDALTEDTWVTLSMELVGESLTVFVNGEAVISASDDLLPEGDLALVFDAEGAKGAEIDLSSVTVTALGEQTAAGDGRGGTRTSQADAGTPAIVAFDGAPEEVMAELAAQNLVPDGGYVLFREDYAWFEGSGAWFTPLARRQSQQDVVMAGELTFAYGESDDFQACSLMTRVQTYDDGSTSAQTEFGLTSFGEAYVFDADFANELFDDFYESWGSQSGDSVHMIFIARGGSGTLFANGELVLENLKLERRSGSFGIGLLSETSESRCEGRDIWVWAWQ